MYSRNHLFKRFILILCALLLVGIPFAPGTQAVAPDRLVVSSKWSYAGIGAFTDFQPTSDGGFVAASGTSVTKIGASGEVAWTTSMPDPTMQVVTVRETADGRYLFAGSANNHFMTGKLNQTGTVIEWGGMNQGAANAIVKTGNEGYAIVGHMRLSLDSDPYLVRTDQNGNYQTRATFPILGDNSIYSALYVGGTAPYVILVGQSTFGVSQGVMAKVDSSWNGMGPIDWVKTYGQNNSSTYTLKSIKNAKDASGQPGYVVTGTEMTNTGLQRVLLLFIGLDGNQKWLRSYASSGDRFGLDVTQTKEGGFAIAGGDNQSTGFLYKTDADGNLQWQKEWSDVGNLHSVSQLANGDYQVAGGNSEGLVFNVSVGAPVGLTADDEANRIIGLDQTMEYSTYGGNRYEPYNPAQAPVFDGDVTVQVRYKADPAGGYEVGKAAAFTFTENSNLPAGHIYNQDGLGFSGTIEPHPLGERVTMTVYNQWPSGFSKEAYAFAGGVFDGENIWMIPHNADRVIKLNKATGEMTGYNGWPKDLSGPYGIYGPARFLGGVYDGNNIWMIPYNADRVVKLDKSTGEMTGYNSWPAGFTKGSFAFAGGIYDGKNIWMIPCNADRVIKLDKTTGEMTGYEEWPDGFSKSEIAFMGAGFDGRNIWMIPYHADRVIKLDTVTGRMTGYDGWPDGFQKNTNSTFAGGVYDGENIWMIPYSGKQVIKLNTATGKMTAYAGGPEGFPNGTGAFAGGIYDNSSIWMIPYSSDRVIRIDKTTGEMTAYTNWPSNFAKGVASFFGSVYDGENIWMIPYHADRVVKLSAGQTYSITYSSNGATGGTVPTDNTRYDAGAAATVMGNTGNLVKTGYTFAGWNTAADGSGTDYASGASLTVAGNTTLYAKWMRDSSSTDLRSLTLSSGVLNPAFSADVQQYTAKVAQDLPSITVTAVTYDNSATVTASVYDGAGALVSGPLALTSGTPSDPLSLSSGTNTLTVDVAAGDSTNKTYTVTLARVTENSPPVADSFQVSTLENRPVSGTLRATDADSDALTYNIVSNGTKGTAEITNTATGEFTYTPGPGATGTDAFTYKASDGQADSAIATVTVQIVRPDTPPPPDTRPPYYPVTEVSLNHDELTLTAGEGSVRLKATILPSYATNQQVTWSSSAPAVASVDEDGTVTPRAAGTAVITVTTADGNKTTSCHVTVQEKTKPKPFKLVTSEKEILLKPNRSTSFKVFAVDAAGKQKDITASPDTQYRSNSSLLSVKKNRLEAGKEEGEATVTITYQGEQREIAVIITKTSVAKLSVSPKELILQPGETKQLELTAKLTDGKKKDVTEKAVWNSSKPSIIEVSDTGELTAVKTGSSIIRATYGGKNLYLKVTVKTSGQEPKRLGASKRTIRIQEGMSEQVTLTAIYADGSTKDVTQEAQWTSKADTIAQVSNGLVTGTGAGKTTVTAKYKNKKITVPVYVEK